MTVVNKPSLVITLIDLHFGGISNLILQSAAELKHHYNLHIIYFGPNNSMEQRFLEKGIIPIRIKYDGIREIFKTVYNFKIFIKKNNIQIVSTNFTPDKLIVGLTRILINFQIIATIHNTYNPEIKRKKIGIKSVFTIFFHNKIANKVIGVSQAAIMNARKFRYLSNPNVCTLYSGIEGLGYIEKTQKGRPVKFITAARFVEIKGLKRLIIYLSLLNEEYKDWKLLLLGDGKLRGELEMLVEEFKLKDKIIFVGYTSDLKTYYEQSDFYINSSFNEALGISIIEAMSTGLPIIGSNVGGIPEVIKHNTSGYLVDFNDPVEVRNYLEKAINMNDEDYINLSRNSYKVFLDKFSLDIYLKNFNKEIFKLCNQ